MSCSCIETSEHKLAPWALERLERCRVLTAIVPGLGAAATVSWGRGSPKYVDPYRWRASAHSPTRCVSASGYETPEDAIHALWVQLLELAP